MRYWQCSENGDRASHSHYKDWYMKGSKCYYFLGRFLVDPSLIFGLKLGFFAALGYSSILLFTDCFFTSAIFLPSAITLEAYPFLSLKCITSITLLGNNDNKRTRFSTGLCQWIPTVYGKSENYFKKYIAQIPATIFYRPPSAVRSAFLNSSHFQICISRRDLEIGSFPASANRADHPFPIQQAIHINSIPSNSKKSVIFMRAAVALMAAATPRSELYFLL